MKNQMKSVIANKFFELAQKKNIDKITVKDLVDACDISRQTFYYHFQDIFEVIEWHAEQLEAEMAAQCREAKSLEGAIRILAAFFVEHHHLLEKLRDSQKRDFVEKLVLDAMQGRFRQAVRESAADAPLDISATEVETLISFFSYGLAGILVSHCQGRTPNVDELTQQILVVFRRLIPGIDETMR